MLLTALIFASANGHLPVCELLLDRGADIHHKERVCNIYQEFICILILILILGHSYTCKFRYDCDGYG
jgi:ankyrin repeat protein